MRWSRRTLPLLHRAPVVIDLYRLIRRPYQESRIWFDLIKTRRATTFLRRGTRRASSSDRTVLVFALTEWIYEIKTLMMLATALQLRGWRGIVLVPSRSSRRTASYCRAFGLSDLVFFDEIDLTAAEMTLCEDVATSYLEGDLTFSRVKDWEFEGSWIGPQILSTVSRMSFKGAPDPGDPATTAEIRSLLPDILRRVKRAGKVLKDVSPDLCLVVEANYATYGPLVDKAIERGVDVIQATQPWRDDALICKRLNRRTRRMSPSSVDPETLADLSSRTWTQKQERELQETFRARYRGEWFLQRRNQPGTAMKDRGQLLQELSLDPTKRIAVVFSHILWDANLFYGDDLFEDYGDWFVQTVRAAVANDDVNWVIKLHPSNIWKRAYEEVEGEYAEILLLNEHVGDLPPHVRLLYPNTDISSFSLFENADFGITVRGTPGMEMACFGKPVFTAGTGRYSGMGFTIDSATAEEYLERLSRIADQPPLTPEQTLLARRHAHAAFHLRPWRMKSFRSEFAYRDRGRDPLDHNLAAVATDFEEVRRNRDLDTWVDWAERPGSVDYIADA